MLEKVEGLLQVKHNSKRGLSNSAMAVDAGDFLAQFSVAFSWDYPDDWSLDDVVYSFFHIREDQDARLFSYTLIHAVSLIYI